MIKTLKKKDNGLSIVELLIAMSILGLVLAVGYMFFNFGSQSFARGERQAIAQQGARIASDFITSELRYATQLDILTAIPSGISDTRYIYQDQENDSIIFRDENGLERVLSDSSVDGMLYRIIFIAAGTSVVSIPEKYTELKLVPLVEPEVGSPEVDLPEDVIFYIIDVDDGLHILTSSVQSLNIDLYSNSIIVDSNAISIIRYKKPE